MSKERLIELGEEIANLEIEREAAVDSGDTERVYELDDELEALRADRRRMEMVIEKADL